MTDAYGAVPSRAGKTVGGRYRIVCLLGAGGMGEVYEAQHTKVSRRFAIKFLHAAHASNPEIVARFQREAESAGALENENIAAVVDFGTADDGAPFLAMEYLEGQDLAHLIKSNGLIPVPRAAYIIIQACRGLAAAHAREIVHRDLKPENLFICKRGDGSDLVKVLDFGIAKLHTSQSFTQTGMTMGTPAYMSPEQARGAKDVDQRTDVYALGVILYEMLSGAKPHPGEENLAILYHVTTQEPVPLDSVRPGLPPGLTAIVQKAMARDPGDRHATVVDLMQALIPFAGRAVTPVYSQVGLVAAGGMAVGATIPSPVSLAAVGVSVLPTPAESKLAEQAGPRRRWWAVAIGSALAVLLAILGLWRAGNHQTSLPPTAPSAIPAAAVAPPPPMPAVVPPPAPPTEKPANTLSPDAALPPTTAENPSSPPEIPPGRPAGQRPRRRATTDSTDLNTRTAPQPSQPSAEPAGEAGIRKRRIRSIDRENPFE